MLQFYLVLSWDCLVRPLSFQREDYCAPQHVSIWYSYEGELNNIY